MLTLFALSFFVIGGLETYNYTANKNYKSSQALRISLCLKDAHLTVEAICDTNNI
jgi:hypothetical protein